LKDQFVGLYLFGSLANGNFDEHSDIDVLVVTDTEISNAAFDALKEMHAQINQLDSPWALQLEVSYIPQQALRRFDPNNKLHPHMDRGTNEVLHLKPHESDWIIQRYLLRQQGVVITGPDLKTLIDPISPSELRQAVMDELPLWADYLLNHTSSLQRCGYQSFCVLSFCRMLYTLQNKAVLSKPAAAQWAIDTLSARWKPLIERALTSRQNPNQQASLEDINETLEMLQYMLEVGTQPSIFSDVNELLHLLLSSVEEILQDQFIGMYLYGSLSSGDFDPRTSDVDFAVVTAGELSEHTVVELETMHKQIWASHLKWAAKLEGAYVPRELIHRHDPDGMPCPTINEGKFYVARLGSDWSIQRHVMREEGIAVAGPDPKTLIDFVGPDEIRGAVINVLQEWWFPMLDDPSWLRDHSREYHAFAILSMCRALHALEQGTIVSKPIAARWAREKLDQKWRPIIDRAILAQGPAPAQFDLYQEALKMIRLMKSILAAQNELSEQPAARRD
jgi:predicted nucleotidyltransferase